MSIIYSAVLSINLTHENSRRIFFTMQVGQFHVKLEWKYLYCFHFKRIIAPLGAIFFFTDCDPEAADRSFTFVSFRYFSF